MNPSATDDEILRIHDEREAKRFKLAVIGMPKVTLDEMPLP